MSKSDKRPMLIKMGDSPFDTIMANHQDPVNFPLSPALQEQADRWFECFTLMLNHRSKPWIVQHWKNKKNLSQAIAYSDIRNAEALYGNVFTASREGNTAKVTLWLEQSLERCIQKGDEMGAQRAIAMMIKAFGLDKEDKNKETNPEKLTNAKIEMMLTQAEIELFRQMSISGQRSNFNLDKPIDVDFEELNDAAPLSSKKD
jgi:hypothetical protein